jgi:hypothetical protein
VNPQEFSWTLFVGDLLIAIVGSGIAVWGALWIADRTFRREVEQEREDRNAEDERRRQDEHKRQETLGREAQAVEMRSLEAVLVEIKLNMRSIDFIFHNPAAPFPLRLDAYSLYLPRMVTLPDTVAEAIQEAVMMVDRYNASADWTSVARMDLAHDARRSLNKAGHHIADYLQPAQANPDAMPPFWRLNYRDGLDPLESEDRTR